MSDAPPASRAQRAEAAPLAGPPPAPGHRDGAVARLLGLTPFGAVFALGMPLAVAAVLQLTFNLAEVWIFGQIGDGGASLAGAAASDIITGIFALLANGLGNAAVARISWCHGAGDLDGVRRHTRQALVVGVLLSLACAVVGVLAEPVGALVMAEGATREAGTAFLRIMALGGFGTIFIAIAIAILRASGDSVRPLALVAAMAIGTLVLEAVFVLGLFGVEPAGVEAAAWITVILRGLVAITAVVLVARRTSLRPPPGERFIAVSALREQLRLGATSAAQQSARLVGFLILLAIVSSRFGDPETNPAYTAINVWVKLDLPTILLAFAWGGGVAPIVGMALGAGRPDYGRRAAWAGVRCVVATALLTMTTMLLFAGPLASAFIPDDAVAVTLTADLYAWAAPVYAFMATGIVISMAYNGAGDMRTPLIWDAIVLLGVQSCVALALAWPDGLGIVGVGVAIALSGLLQGVIPAWLLRKAPWHRDLAR